MNEWMNWMNRINEWIKQCNDDEAETRKRIC